MSNAVSNLAKMHEWYQRSTTRPYTHRERLDFPFQVLINGIGGEVQDRYFSTREAALSCHDSHGGTVYEYTKSKPWGYFNQIK